MSEYKGKIPNLKQIADKTEKMRVEYAQKDYDAFFDEVFKKAEKIAQTPDSQRSITITIKSENIQPASLATHRNRLNREYFDSIVEQSNDDEKITIDDNGANAVIKITW